MGTVLSRRRKYVDGQYSYLNLSEFYVGKTWREKSLNLFCTNTFEFKNSWKFSFWLPKRKSNDA